MHYAPLPEMKSPGIDLMLAFCDGIYLAGFPMKPEKDKNAGDGS